METIQIQPEGKSTMGQRVKSSILGNGTVAEINGGVSAVDFEDGDEPKGQVPYFQPAETLERLREKFRACWVRGTAWRFEVGELLYNIKEKAEHGEWGTFLDEFGLARSTADDYVRRYMDEAQITLPRQFNEPTPDPEANGRMSLIEEEHKKREGRKPTEHATDLHIRIKDLKPDQLTRYKIERIANPDRVKTIWQMAFIEVIGVEEIGEAPDKEMARIATEGVQCSA